MNDNPISAEVIKDITGFLACFDTSAVAHAREELTAEQISSIRAFANGDLDEAARKAVFPLLSRNTTALEFLADLLKGDDLQSAVS